MLLALKIAAFVAVWGIVLWAMFGSEDNFALRLLGALAAFFLCFVVPVGGLIFVLAMGMAASGAALGLWTIP